MWRVGIDHWVYACGWREERTDTPEEISKYPSIVHSRRVLREARLGDNAIWSRSGWRYRWPRQKNSLENVGLRWMCNNEWRWVLLDVLIFPSELWATVRDVAICVTLSPRITHPLEGGLGRHVLEKELKRQNDENRSEREGLGRFSQRPQNQQ